MNIEEKCINYAKKWLWPHADTYIFRISKKGRYIITAYHDNTFGPSDINEHVFTEEELKIIINP